jgi:hypothetical protein
MNATATSCTTGTVIDDDCQDLKCDEEFMSSDPFEESEPESDIEDEQMYETETDEDHITDMDTDMEQPRTYKR